MSGIHLSKRLATVAQFVPENSRLADIGSDHAFLPIYLSQQKRIQAAVAGEVITGPFEIAHQHVQNYGLQTTIDVRLGDGLEVLSPTDDGIDCIVIAGMGGLLITEILERGQQHLNGHERLILQANITEPAVREWLMNHDYQIIDEDIVAEENHIYEVIVAEPTVTPVRYTESQLLFGPVLMQKKPTDFITKWTQMWTKRQHLLGQLEQAQSAPVAKVQEVQHELQLIEEMMATWQ
ncbi:tRNA (adenine(22)-N(1))-methyltransferase [Latilactobacillus fuchuensis]|uniref:SAM-dependent methyltransferase n=1 Tax=Latilactobacillus fuchuensis DSM 14340 = JCM 11249 TaxID=1423747 RepID=A0A0R1RY38_9LACO|nr:tRNA (adenine(22)-N(1))-methyltransferase TrmK [Latilactobacillus fuchuensis]KRL61278.1 hypothetical protein FC69_GL000856 [Latilactobacillus fuchuensis DSM 14340 = JCM 11249]